MATTLGEHELSESALNRPQFTLRALFGAVTLLCCLFALMSALGAPGSLMLLLVVMLALAHVVGNSLGTRLRDQTSRRVGVARGARTGWLEPSRPVVAAPQRLTQRARLSRIAPVISIGGALVGGTLGGVGVSEIYPQASLAAAGLGVVSSAVLGAFAGFLTSSFLSVAWLALREALGDVDAPPSGAMRSPSDTGPDGNRSA